MKKQISKKKHSTFHNLTLAAFICGYIAIALVIVYFGINVALDIKNRSGQVTPEFIDYLRVLTGKLRILVYFGLLAILAMGVILIAQSVEVKYYHDLGGALTTKNMQRAFYDILLGVIIAIVLYGIAQIAPWPRVSYVIGEEKYTELVWWAQIIQSIFEWLAAVVILGTITTQIVLNTVIFSRITYGKK